MTTEGMQLYYYTNTDTMRFILEKADIFATNIHYMNDAEEYVNGLNEIYRLMQDCNVIKEWKNKNGIEIEEALIKDVFNEENLRRNQDNMEYYSISFCKKNDLLSQWAIYAKESGVSIKMNFMKAAYEFSAPALKTEGNLSEEAEKREALWKLKPREIEYFTYESMKNGQLKDYEEAAFRILDRLYRREDDPIEDKQEVWRYQSTFVKRYDFYQEAECRLIFDPIRSPEPPQIEYRSDKKVLKPYLDITCKNGWPIWEIMVGPGFNQNIVYESLQHFLDHAEVKNGIENAAGYMERVEAYLSYLSEFSVSGNEYYKRLKAELARKDKLSEKNIEDIKIMFWNTLRDMRQSVLSSSRKGEAREYLESNYFTRSGIVLTRSTIPYIF